jgi:archaellum component FlaC
MIKQLETDREFYSDCESELGRLKAMMKEMGEKKNSMPSEREEIKDRIIMKLED